MSRSIKIYFYQICLDNHDRNSFQNLLQELFHSQPVDRLIEFAGRKHLLGPISDENGFFCWLARERQNNWPHLILDDGDIRELDLAENGSLGELGYFLFLLDRGLLLEAVNWHGPTKSVLQSYISTWSRKTHSRRLTINLRPILRREAYEVLMNVSAASRMTFKLEVATPGARLIDEIFDSNRIGAALGALQEIGPMTLKTELTMGKSGQSLTLSALRNLISLLHNNSSTKKLQLKARMADNDRQEVIDLLGSNRIYYEVALLRNQPYLRRSEIRQVMSEGLERQNDYLNQFVGTE